MVLLSKLDLVLAPLIDVSHFLSEAEVSILTNEFVHLISLVILLIGLQHWQKLVKLVQVHYHR